MTLSRSILTRLYTQMLEIRIFEELVADLLKKGKILCPTHLCIGQEAISAGACAALTKGDLVWGAHRSHGPFIGKVRQYDGLMAELLVQEGGVSRGYGGSMHLVERKKGFMGSTAIVAGTLPLAVGGGLALDRTRKRNVSVSFFGDGATDEGVFFECINLAALYRLPVLFICENNLYSTHRRIVHRQARQDIRQKVAAFGLRATRSDGNDVFSVYRNVQEARRYVLEERRPAFLEFTTYRWLAHVGASEDLDFDFRTREEVASWQRRCPILRAEKLLLAERILSEKQMVQLKKRISRKASQSYLKASSAGATGRRG
jgi:acetoin:2,6-dichlorophenolindophenol oxidoreductase subunit alpha